MRATREHSDGVLSGLGHTCWLAATALAGCLLLVVTGCVVSIGWQSNRVLAVVLVLALLTAVGYGLALAVARPSRDRRQA